MQDLIKKIVNMDEKAQEITEDARRRKAHLAQEIAEKKDQLREDYLAKARKRIEFNRAEEKKRASQLLTAAAEKHQAQLDHMDSLYAQKGDQWVDAIVGRVIGE